MKRIASIVFILLLAFTFSACKKKNYPSDIPKWLKEKIDVMNNESRKKGCIYSVCRTVDEYNDGSSTFYWVAIGTASPLVILFIIMPDKKYASLLHPRLPVEIVVTGRILFAKFGNRVRSLSKPFPISPTYHL